MKEILDGRYAITTTGEVFGLNDSHGEQLAVPRRLKTRLCPGGYPSVRMYTGMSDGKKVYVAERVHRLVAKTFLPNPAQAPQVNHIDGNKLNPRLENLEWCTASENSQHAYNTGLKVSPRAMLGRFNERHPRSLPVCRYSLTGELLETYPSINEAGRQGYHMSNLVSAIKGRNHTASGFRWSYAGDPPSQKILSLL